MSYFLPSYVVFMVAIFNLYGTLHTTSTFTTTLASTQSFSQRSNLALILRRLTYADKAVAVARGVGLGG